MDIDTLSKDIAAALEDHALLHWEQQPKAAQIIRSFVNDYIKKVVRDFYD
jgi:hypothetical protein